MQAPDTPVAVSDVFFGLGSPCTVERAHRSDLDELLDGDETLQLAEGSSLDNLEASLPSPIHRRSRARAQRGPSPLKYASQHFSSSPSVARRSSPSPGATMASAIPARPRQSVWLIDFEGRLASPAKKIDASTQQRPFQSLMDDLLSPCRPAASNETLSTPLVDQDCAIPAIDLQEAAILPAHGRCDSPSPLLLSPVAITSPLRAAITRGEVALGSRSGEVEDESSDAASAEEKILTAAEDAGSLAAPAGTLLTAEDALPVDEYGATERSRDNCMIEQMEASDTPGLPESRSTEAITTVNGTRSEAQEAINGQQPLKQSVIIALQAKSKIAQPTLRGPASRAPVPSTSRLPGPASGKSLLPAKQKSILTTSRAAPLTAKDSASEPNSPVKISNASKSAPSQNSEQPSTTSVVKGASPGAVQRAAERVFGYAAHLSANPAPAMQASASPPRRAVSPHRVASPRGHNAVLLAASPKTLSPSRPASPRRVAEAATNAFGQLLKAPTSATPEETKTPNNLGKDAQTSRLRRKKAAAPATSAPRTAPVAGSAPADPIETSGVQIQSLTNRHTTRNAIAYNTYTIVVDRRAGPRPPSPSSRLRKDANRAARDDRAKKRQAMQNTTRRASRAAAASTDEGDDDAKNGASRRKRPHPKGAGDDDEYESPIKRRKEANEKIVKWDRKLVSVVGGSEVSGESVFDAQPLQSIVKASRQLDRHGNALNAKAPLSPLFPRESVTISKVIYDDDEGA